MISGLRTPAEKLNTATVNRQSTPTCIGGSRLSRRKRGKAFAAVESVDEVEHGPLSAVCVDPP
ncbi:hypothetical protein, partial [Micromonospora sp. NPDC051296]|uniref:hypothetical protein n=1 Tax=Micromonospora sp. NPDC051296 TaxID=3155046 RepID=UPI0034234CAD